MDNTEIIAQSNRFIQAKYSESLTFWESFIFAKTCSLIQKEETEFNEYKLYLKEMLDYIDVPASGEAYKLIYEASLKLLERRITFTVYNAEGKKEIIETHLIMGVSRLAQPQKGENLYFKVLLHPALKPYLLQLKNDYSMFHLADYKTLRTHTAIRVYEILKSWYGRKKFEVTYEIEELKEMLGLKGKYDHFGGFKKKVLDEAQAKIKENMDLCFEYLVIKKGRDVHSILFKISPNKPKAFKKKTEKEVQPTLFDNSKSEAKEKLFEELLPIIKTWGVGISAFMKLLDKNPEENIRKAIKMTKEAEKVGKVKNLAGFFTQAVKDAYVPATEANDKLQKEAKAKIEAEKAKKQAEEEQVLQAKRDIYQKEKEIFLKMVKENPALTDELLEKGKQNNPLWVIYLDKYDKSKTLEENFETGGTMMESAFLAVIMELYPEKFNG